MKKINTAMFFALSLLSFSVLLGCAEEGEEGSVGVDCGSHGSEHAGHCHCDPGYLFDGTTCVSPDDIDEICEGEHERHEHETEEHGHGACECPAEGACPCDHGEIEEHAGRDYCVPELHGDA